MGTFDQFYRDIFSEMLQSKEQQLRMEGLRGEELKKALEDYEERLIKDYM